MNATCRVRSLQEQLERESQAATAKAALSSASSRSHLAHLDTARLFSAKSDMQGLLMQLNALQHGILSPEVCQLYLLHVSLYV